MVVQAVPGVEPTSPGICFVRTAPEMQPWGLSHIWTGVYAESMKLTQAKVNKRVQTVIFLLVEDAPVMMTEGSPGDHYKIRPESISGDWSEDTPSYLRRVTVRGRVLNILSEAHLSREFALHEPPEDWETMWPLAPEWVFEALKEAGVEY